MRISYRWLGRHVDLAGVSPEDVARDLTIHTAEVEGVERFAPALAEVVVGRVVERAKHPGADKLSLCRVDLGPAGTGELLQIVCGAPNVAEGQRVAVARVGTRLPGDLVIQKAGIRGESSAGMICSERELGLGDEHAGIWVLPADAEVGSPVDRALGADDWVLEIDNKSLTHRPDCWGHRGIAAEIAAIRRLALRPLVDALPEPGAGEPYPVRVETPGCSRYLGLPIDLPEHLGRTPEWMRLLLLAAGQRPIDLLVDVSNFVMLDLGQPNHLFDRRRLAEDGIVVRDAREGERMTTLDGLERALEPSDVLICSGDEPVALAGVMGGEGSKVAADTRELLLEVATFHPARVRRTAMRLGLRSEASARFEKNLDPTLPPRAAGHVVRLLEEIVPGARVPRPPGDAGDWTDPSRTVALRPERVRALLGAELPDGEIADALGRLGLAVERPPGGGRAPWSVRIPSARATRDLAIEEDLVEEVGRLRGYAAFPVRPVTVEAVPAPRDERRTIVRRVQDRLAGGARFHETLAYSFVPDELARVLGIAELPHVEVENPVLQELGRVRRSVAPSLVALLEPNLRRREEVRLFEVGKGYLPEQALGGGEPREVHEAALVWAAPRPPRGAPFGAGVLPRLRGVVEDLLASLGRPAARWEHASERGEAPPWAHPARTLAALSGDGDGERSVAVVGALDPAVARALGERVAGADAAFAVVSLDRLLELPESPPGIRPIPRFPALEVDVALALPADVPAAEAAAAVETAGEGLVAGLELFDLYEGESVGPGRKSLAWHVSLQAPDRTLAEADQTRFLERLERAIAERGGELRRE